MFNVMSVKDVDINAMVHVYLFMNMENKGGSNEFTEFVESVFDEKPDMAKAMMEFYEGLAKEGQSFYDYSYAARVFRTVYERREFSLLTQTTRKGKRHAI